MKYISTRGDAAPVSASTAIRLGIAPDGGLFVPDRIPVLAPEQIRALRGKNYIAVAQRIISPFLDDYSNTEVVDSLRQAYNETNFTHSAVAPLYSLDENMHILELWYGPTAAFKDMALQLMPHLLSRALQKAGQAEELVILVATSGDTGKAALEGFCDVPGIRIIVFYPHGGVSRVQELQMTTTPGANTHVVAVRGNFDDCQNAVKDIFTDREMAVSLAQQGYLLSSANSINWGRLLPQIVYYFWAWLQLTEKKQNGDTAVNIVVPTGNFGNILAAWYAWRMGLPVKKLICASNENRVLTDFFNSGVYDSNRELRLTSSPSMDILISSNLERLLFAVSGGDAVRIKQLMSALKNTAVFQVDSAMQHALNRIIHAGSAGETEAMTTIRNTYNYYGYLVDTHTAVALSVYNNYRTETKDFTPAIIASTASPFKFSRSVLNALKDDDCRQGDEFAILAELSKLSGIPIHPSLRELQFKTVRHRDLCHKQELKQKVIEILSNRS